MKTLMVDKNGVVGGWYLVEFKPIENDWYSWKTHDGKIKLIHEKCYFQIAMHRGVGLPHFEDEGACAFCGVEAPERIQQFTLMATAIRNYKT